MKESKSNKANLIRWEIMLEERRNFLYQRELDKQFGSEKFPVIDLFPPAA